jgi:hypothetical protein
MMRPKDRDQVTEKLSSIIDLSRADLVERWTIAHGRPPPKAISRRRLEYSAAYQLQVKAFGGLNPAVRRKLRRKMPSDDKTVATSVPRKPVRLSPGTRLVREWHGHTHIVEVVEGSFLYNGEPFTSLSKVAYAITGARWSGPRFFGV